MGESSLTVMQNIMTKGVMESLRQSNLSDFERETMLFWLENQVTETIELQPAPEDGLEELWIVSCL